MLKRQILTKDDLEKFKTSSAHSIIVDFINSLNLAVRDSKNCLESDSCLDILTNLIHTLKNSINSFPPVPSSSRFGNVAFRSWFDDMQSTINSTLLHNDIKCYLINSFGDRQRIDYGSGHELSFIAALACCDLVGLFNKTHHAKVVHVVFKSYCDLMRLLQKVYWLEPAGSHGVWGLDDYHFMPFVFGSSQLFSHKYISPKAIHDNEIVSEFSNDYVYFDFIKNINQVKSVGLAWHSPMLNDISGVKTWKKVNSGLLLMYSDQVLSKLPVMQHFLFGSLIPFDGTDFDGKEQHEHVFAFGQEFPTCCGMRIPSAVAGMSGMANGRIPFD